MSGEQFAANHFVSGTFAAYHAFLAASPEKFNSETGLGGQLFFAGRLNEAARTQLVAANISGAASLAVAEDAESGKAALRDGVVDFLVSSLDEALRILKNEIRKKQPTSVAVSAPFDAVVAEMRERGVQPDLQNLENAGELSEAALICVHGAAPQLARVDQLVRELMPDAGPGMERWNRLSARYLGRLANGMRTYGCRFEFGVPIVAGLRERIQAEAIEARVDLAR
jgi:hypothetical protein